MPDNDCLYSHFEVHQVVLSLLGGYGRHICKQENACLPDAAVDIVYAPANSADSKNKIIWLRRTKNQSSVSSCRQI